MATLSATDFQKHSLPTAAALEFGEQRLRNVAGFASLIRPERLVRPFAIAPITATEAELVAFESGKYWSQSVCDEALVALVSYPSPWWAVSQTAWLKPEDFANFDSGDHFFFSENHFHVTQHQGQLDPESWGSVSSGFPTTV